jgi:hypothetical protein
MFGGGGTQVVTPTQYGLALADRAETRSAPVDAHWFWPNSAKATDAPVKQDRNPIRIRRLKNADCEIAFLFMIFLAIVFPEIRGEVPEIFRDN